MWIAEQAALHRLTGHWFTVMSERSLPVTGLRSCITLLRGTAVALGLLLHLEVRVPVLVAALLAERTTMHFDHSLVISDRSIVHRPRPIHFLRLAVTLQSRYLIWKFGG